MAKKTRGTVVDISKKMPRKYQVYKCGKCLEFDRFVLTVEGDIICMNCDSLANKIKVVRDE